MPQTLFYFHLILQCKDAFSVFTNVLSLQLLFVMKSCLWFAAHIQVKTKSISISSFHLHPLIVTQKNLLCWRSETRLQRNPSNERILCLLRWKICGFFTPCLKRNAISIFFFFAQSWLKQKTFLLISNSQQVDIFNMFWFMMTRFIWQTMKMPTVVEQEQDVTHKMSSSLVRPTTHNLVCGTTKCLFPKTLNGFKRIFVTLCPCFVVCNSECGLSTITENGFLDKLKNVFVIFKFLSSLQTQTTVLLSQTKMLQPNEYYGDAHMQLWKRDPLQKDGRTVM